MRKDKPAQMNKDPVCGMSLNLQTAACETRYRGKTYYFCAGVCRDAFDADPEQFISHSRKWRKSVRSRPHQHQQYGLASFRHG